MPSDVLRLTCRGLLSAADAMQKSFHKVESVACKECWCGLLTQGTVLGAPWQQLLEQLYAQELAHLLSMRQCCPQLAIHGCKFQSVGLGIQSPLLQLQHAHAFACCMSIPCVHTIYQIMSHLVHLMFRMAVRLMLPGCLCYQVGWHAVHRRPVLSFSEKARGKKTKWCEKLHVLQFVNRSHLSKGASVEVRAPVF